MKERSFDLEFGVEGIGAKSPEVVPSSPEFTAERDEGFRYQRLHFVWGHACSTVRLLSKLYQHRWQGAILHLEDSKGVLSVTWRDKESRLAFEGVIVGAWEANGEHSHIHFLARL